MLYPEKVTCKLGDIQKAFKTLLQAEAHTIEQFLSQVNLHSIGKLHSDELTKETIEEIDKANLWSEGRKITRCRWVAS